MTDSAPLRRFRHGVFGCIHDLRTVGRSGDKALKDFLIMRLHPVMKTLPIKCALVTLPKVHQIIIKKAAIVNRRHGCFPTQKCGRTAGGKINTRCDFSIVANKNGIARILITDRLFLRRKRESSGMYIIFFVKAAGL